MSPEVTTLQSAGIGSARTPRTLIPGIPKRVHLLGAGGAGVSGAGLILHAHGHTVTGHDRADSNFVAKLKQVGIPVTLGATDAAELPRDVELVARTAALGADDPQVAEAARRGVPVWKYAELLGRIGPERRTIAVAGTHGKTTTSWMTFHALRGIAEAAGGTSHAPGALIGGTCRVVEANAVAPEADGWFACEACEFDRSFLQLSPEGAIVTNIEPDHLDYYGSLAAIEEAFARFVDRIHPDGLLVVGRDVPAAVVSAAPCDVWRLGRELHIDLLGESHGHFRFRLRGPGFATPPVTLSVPGAFNVENAALALGLAIGLAAPAQGVGPDAAAAAAARTVHRYKGALRRFEPWGTVGGVELIHDYAHHPTEVRVTLEAARRTLPGKPIHVLFQPHQHSRTARFLEDFVESLRGADRVVVADVYGARAHIDSKSAGAPELVTLLSRAGVDAVLGGEPKTAILKLCERLPAGGAALILGAGDIDNSKNDLIEELALRGPAARGSLR
ncbi:MAG: UDP-N-acetylmuramate--L-alanine ligase [Planctomycetes bacterium]|nr:UDP-N-acetylmuramate--L-alanine ligase [Planctomycetota bacterium]